MKKIKILIVDDHEIIHNGINDILKSCEQYEISGHAYNGEEGIQKALQIMPDIIFMDISMPLLNGIEATRKIMNAIPAAKIIALTQHEEMEYVSQFLKAGGSGYLLKNSGKDEFTEAIESVIKNKKYLSYSVSEQMIQFSMQKNEEKNQEEPIYLTRREKEIIMKIADDKSNQQIADELNISLRTVETHRRNLMQKLKVKSVVAMIKYAAANKLIDL